MTIGEPRPKSLKSVVGLGLVTEGFVMNFLTGVSAGAGVVVMVVGDMGRLRFLDRLAGWLPECSDTGGTSFATVTSMFMVSESDDRLELLLKDGARLSDLEVAEAAKESARFIF